MGRISRLELYTGMVDLIAKRSHCPRHQVGALLIKDNRVIAIGYNGVLPGVPPSFGVNPDGSSNTVHAEANLISFCAKEGIPTSGCDIYISLSPCKKCAELIIQAGIKRVYYRETYRDIEGLEILRTNNIEHGRV